jgi:GntR family transcriptional repressor for pyruvate dehydrogenase complex
MERIKKKSVTDQVYDMLKKSIQDGEFKPGEQLPTEKQLSETLGVSKTSVRAAIQKLASIGVIETKVGLGSFVTDLNPDQLFHHICDFLLSDNDINEITQYRIATEMATVKCAIQYATEENYKRMENLVKQMCDSLQHHDLILHGKLDYEFHMELCHATQNKLFGISYSLMGKTLLSHTTKLNLEYFKKPVSNNYQDDVHYKLIMAMQKKDLEACEACFKEMLMV